MYHVPGIRYDIAAVRSIPYHQYLVPEYSYVLLLLYFYFGKKRISPATSVILIHGSGLCIHEEQPTKATRPNEAMSDRLALLLSLLLFLMLPLLPALPMLLLCCYQHRIGVLAGGGDAVHFFVSISERVQTMGARCHVYQSVPGIIYTCTSL